MSRSKDSGSAATPGEARWAEVVQSLELGIFAVDERGLVIVMNQAAEQMTGCSLASAFGEHHREVLERDAWLSRLIDDAEEREQAIRAEGELAGRFGKAIPVRAIVSPVIDASGHRTGIVVTLQDLLLQLGIEADEQRTRSLSTLGTAVAGLAHEIKNPLSGIRGAVQLLGMETAKSPRAEEYIGLVLREVDRLTGLLEQLLQLGSRGRTETAPVNVHRVIDHVLAVADEAIRQGGVRVLRAFDPSLPEVRGNEDSLIQVLLNLVQNALQAMVAVPPGSRRELQLTTRIETGYRLATAPGGRSRFLRIDVEDSGPGIPDTVQPRLFSPFFTTKPKGTGLGLAVSHRIVAEHGGSIRFESGPGRTVFRVILPAWEERGESS